MRAHLITAHRVGEDRRYKDYKAAVVIKDNETVARILVTGAAGFIGFHLAARLLERGDEVLGVDNLTQYYDVKLKRDRLARLENSRFRFARVDISDGPEVLTLFQEFRPQIVVKRFVGVLEGLLGRKANIQLSPMQPGDVYSTLPTSTSWSRRRAFSLRLQSKPAFRDS